MRWPNTSRSSASQSFVVLFLKGLTVSCKPFHRNIVIWQDQRNQLHSPHCPHGAARIRSPQWRELSTQAELSTFVYLMVAGVQRGQGAPIANFTLANEKVKLGWARKHLPVLFKSLLVVIASLTLLGNVTWLLLFLFLFLCNWWILMASVWSFLPIGQEAVCNFHQLPKRPIPARLLDWSNNDKKV